MITLTKGLLGGSFYACEQAVEQTVNQPVIWDALW